MKHIGTCLLIFFVVSCASERIERKIDEEEYDSMASESYLRWGQDRLKSRAKDEHAVVSCYQGKADETLELYKKDYLKGSQTPYYWLHIGNCYFNREEWSKAEFFYRMTLDESKIPTIRSIALNNLGLIHFKHEQWEKGRESLKESMKLAPKFKVPRYNLSQLYLQFGLFEKAIEMLTDPIFRGHNDVDINFSLANAYLYKDDLMKAKDYFARLPESSFKREDIAATYALFLIRQGDLARASTIMDERERSGVKELTLISQKIERMLVVRMKQE